MLTLIVECLRECEMSSKTEDSKPQGKSAHEEWIEESAMMIPAASPRLGRVIAMPLSF